MFLVSRHKGGRLWNWMVDDCGFCAGVLKLLGRTAYILVSGEVLQTGGRACTGGLDAALLFGGAASRS